MEYNEFYDIQYRLEAATTVEDLGMILYELMEE
jgi:hypothetical protein